MNNYVGCPSYLGVGAVERVKVNKESLSYVFVFTFYSKFSKIMMPEFGRRILPNLSVILVADALAWLAQHFTGMKLLVYMYMHVRTVVMRVHMSRKEILSPRDL